MRQLLDDAAIGRVDLEMLTGWWATGQRRREADTVHHGILARIDQAEERLVAGKR